MSPDPSPIRGGCRTAAVEAEPPQPLSLQQALRLAADDLARQPPPPFERIWPAAAPPAGAVASRPGPRVRRPAWSRAGWGSVFAGAAALGWLMLVLQPRAPAPTPAAPQVVVRDGWELLAGGFVPVAGAERWIEPGRQAAPGWIVRAELPAEHLAGLGLPFDPAQAAERVPAELLLHANGELLAVRVLP
jgi:hypothetical protein